MTVPQTTPLLLVSEYNSWLTAGSGAISTPVGLTGIIRASSFLQRLCGRRFDYWYESRFFTATDISRGGDVRHGYDLLLDNDLRSVSALWYLVNQFIGVPPASGTQITSGYTLQPAAMQDGVNAYNVVRLNPYGTRFWYSASTDPVNSICVQGYWGYGGRWLALGATVNSIADAVTTSITVSDGTQFESGMVIQVESESMYVDQISNNTLTVVRGFNNTTAVAHNTTPPYSTARWQPMELVSEQIVRLLQWRREQVKSPLFGMIVAGDISFPVDTTTAPKDVHDAVDSARLRRANATPLLGV